MYDRFLNDLYGDLKPLQYIPKDVSRCNNGECPLKDNCARYLQLKIDSLKGFHPCTCFQFIKSNIIINVYCDFQILVK